MREGDEDKKGCRGSLLKKNKGKRNELKKEDDHLSEEKELPS